MNCLDRRMDAGPDDNAAAAGHLVASLPGHHHRHDADQAGSLVAEAYQCHGSNVGPMGTLRPGNEGVTGGVPFIADLAFALTSASPRYDPSNEPLIVEEVIGTLSSHSKRHGHAMNTHQAAEAGPIVFDPRQITSAENRSNPQPGDPVHTLHAIPPAVAFCAKDYEMGEYEQSDVAAPVTTSRDRNRASPIVSFQTRIARNGRGQPKEVIDALVSAESGSHGDSKPHVTTAAGVRRLTPLECERCQGMPDNWTQFGMTEGGKKVKLSDSARYRLIGNSVAVPTVAWIVKRIAALGTNG